MEPNVRADGGVGTTLSEIRAGVESLAEPTGAYYLVCARTGERPFPADGLRFPSRAVARNAARTVERYRSTLRQYDPQVPRYDIVVHEAGGGDGVPEAGPDTRLTEFCHDVAAAVFEALPAAGLDGVERAVMDAYFEHAESLSDPDDLCLCLLEAMATELDARLTTEEEADVLRRAATELDAGEGKGAFERLRRVGLVEGYALRGREVELSGYALAPRGDRLPVLPIAIALLGRDGAPAALRAATTDDGWRLTPDEGGSGLASARIGGA